MIRLFLALLTLVVATVEAAAQTGSIMGTIVDRGTGQPLRGVHVQIVGTNTSALSDPQGRFRLLDAPAGQQTLRA
ncbi:MAG: carboxypeptidase-like regulatory domain-containing protein, partial [Longimicrobiales bacterium]